MEYLINNLIKPKYKTNTYIYTEKEILKLLDRANNQNLKLITTDKNYNSIPEKYKKIIYSTSIKLIINNYNDFLNEIN